MGLVKTGCEQESLQIRIAKMEAFFVSVNDEP